MDKIIVDINGADQSPHALVDGAVLSLDKPEFGVVLIGQSATIQKELQKHNYQKSRIEIADAHDIVIPDDKPTEVLRTKKESSLVKGLYALKERDDIVGFLSAGNTGAILAGGVFVIGRMDGVARPALAALIPNLGGGRVCICDTGANVDSKPEYLNQYAILSSCYMQAFLDVASPRIALLNNGTESSKGNELSKATFALLQNNDKINFVGNIEARHALDDVADVLVTDGFVGNVLLKSIEGTAVSIFKMLKQGILSGGAKQKLGAVLLKKTFGQIRTKMDYQTVGGAPLLGLNKLLMKAHGSSGAASIAQSIWDIHKMHKRGMLDNIKQQLSGDSQ